MDRGCKETGTAKKIRNTIEERGMERVINGEGEKRHKEKGKHDKEEERGRTGCM